MSSDVMAAKKKLRSEMAQIINSLTLDSITAQSTSIFEKLKKHEKFISAERISVYLSLEREIDTIPILEHIFRLNKKCYVPQYIAGTKQMNMVLLKSMEDYRSLPLTTKYKIKQPPISDTWRENGLEVGLELILTPGVAFTRAGQRLGHGAGYYDRFLHSYSDRWHDRMPYIMALALKEQVLESIPTEPHDYTLNEVLTG